MGYHQNPYYEKRYRLMAQTLPHNHLRPKPVINQRFRSARFSNQMLQGFMYGAGAGACLGFAFGIVPTIRHRQISILITSMLISAGMFSCIGGFGSFLHGDSGSQEELQSEMMFAQIQQEEQESNESKINYAFQNRE